jgi:hypothetical protein
LALNGQVFYRLIPVPTCSPHVTDGLEYRRKVYTYNEIWGVIEKYGIPQETWNEPIFAQPSYVEVQVWSDNPIDRYRMETFI